MLGLLLLVVDVSLPFWPCCLCHLIVTYMFAWLVLNWLSLSVSVSFCLSFCVCASLSLSLSLSLSCLLACSLTVCVCVWHVSVCGVHACMCVPAWALTIKVRTVCLSVSLSISFCLWLVGWVTPVWSDVRGLLVPPQTGAQRLMRLCAWVPGGGVRWVVCWVEVSSAHSATRLCFIENGCSVCVSVPSFDVPTSARQHQSPWAHSVNVDFYFCHV